MVGSLVAKLCLILCDPMDYNPPVFSVHGILQARILKRVAISFCRGSSQPRDRTRVSCIAGRFFTYWATCSHWLTLKFCIYWFLTVSLIYLREVFCIEITMCSITLSTYILSSSLGLGSFRIFKKICSLFSYPPHLLPLYPLIYLGFPNEVR